MPYIEDINRQYIYTLFYILLSVYFSLILGDLQKEKLQIVSIFRFGYKKRGLFQCPPKGRGVIRLLGLNIC